MRRRYFHGESSLKLETPSSGPAPLFRKADRKFLPSKAVSNSYVDLDVSSVWLWVFSGIEIPY
ncbi:hypothetical protein ES288_A13G166800v1 [Gossypium darwinii]|uniref:Uncharacterized protein n=2 Tax=Gossypium TaxID=3633 RepID=A0A5D2E0A9_GOSDA|nr:hypothetical protein ES288_A13G166800v1 [Gossypium darwinii]TYG86863.1 hypothetical protein ES288_A13G166800v1 [Gossypium darwinii]TYH92252.1 hypothetical protein ES332_A13G169500v1 [Gossypium tomentosum]